MVQWCGVVALLVVLVSLCVGQPTVDQSLDASRQCGTKQDLMEGLEAVLLSGRHSAVPGDGGGSGREEGCVTERRLNASLQIITQATSQQIGQGFSEVKEKLSQTVEQQENMARLVRLINVSLMTEIEGVRQQLNHAKQLLLLQQNDTQHSKLLLQKQQNETQQLKQLLLQQQNGQQNEMQQLKQLLLQQRNDTQQSKLLMQKQQNETELLKQLLHQQQSDAQQTKLLLLHETQQLKQLLLQQQSDAQQTKLLLLNETQQLKQLLLQQQQNCTEQSTRVTHPFLEQRLTTETPLVIGR